MVPALVLVLITIVLFTVTASLQEQDNLDDDDPGSRSRAAPARGLLWYQHCFNFIRVRNVMVTEVRVNASCDASKSLCKHAMYTTPPITPRL